MFKIILNQKQSIQKLNRSLGRCYGKGLLQRQTGVNRSTLLTSSISASKHAQEYATHACGDKHKLCNQFLLQNILDVYRSEAHTVAHVNPLQNGDNDVDARRQEFRKRVEEKYLSCGIAEDSLLATAYNVNGANASYAALLDHLDESYAASIGAELGHLKEAERDFLAERLEAPKVNADKLDLLRAYDLLLTSQSFDQFVQKKLPFVKRYGLEGNEAMMVALDAMFASLSAASVPEAVIGMPHRGRLNLLVGLLDFPASTLFAKMNGARLLDAKYGTDDVLSHVAQSVDVDTHNGGKLHVSLIHNPSHLEAVNPVAQGKVRAKQDLALNARGVRVPGGDDGASLDVGVEERRTEAACIVLHGDAAMAGQGVVTETLMLANLPAFHTAGTIHLVVNNQVGFTTEPKHGRSSAYATDVAKVIGAPVLHVNAEDPAAVQRVTRLAVEYRQRFGKDVFVDLIGYRRHGHNELDEPSFTQPAMYANIRARTTAVDAFAAGLVADGVLSEAEHEKKKAALEERWSAEFKKSQAANFKPYNTHLRARWSSLRQGLVDDVLTPVDTGVSVEELRELGALSVAVDSSVAVHKRLKKGHVDARTKRFGGAETDASIDWATAESLAFASLLRDGFNVRLCGQDAGRGTFSHRHALLTCQKSGRLVMPLGKVEARDAEHRRDGLGRLHVVNSPLSEFAVMGFEYGYSLESPRNLVLWEAQFGDFANGAQIIIDQFVSTGEDKWLRQSSLALLLPHGYDGAGPEHSSCRIERFLGLASDNKLTNLCVVNPTTPAQYFHLLRRQMTWPFRKPLVVVAPKTLLRLAACQSSLASMAPGTHFEAVLDVDNGDEAASCKRVVLCSGKIYYDLVKEREQRSLASAVALVRIEQLAPFPKEAVANVLAKYSSASDVIWVQEEPRNQGAYLYVKDRLGASLTSAVSPRPLGPSAVGYGSAYRSDQKLVIDGAFDGI